MSVAHVYIYGFVDEDLLKSIEGQLLASKDATEIKEHYDTPGGYVEVGKKIKALLQAQNKPRTAIAEGRVMSIGTIPFLSAQKRIALKKIGDKNLMIHNPWGKPEGDADKMEHAAKVLREMESDMAIAYEESTTLTKEEALALMKEETFLSLDKAKEIGFIHEVVEEEPLKAVALFKEDQKQNQDKMSKNQITPEQAKELQEGMNGLQKLFSKIGNIFKSEEVKALAVQDANGVEIDFYELEEDANPAIGDKANVDGSPASGEHVMPSGETFVFADGALSEIKEKEEESDEEMENLKTENENLKSEIENLKAEKKNLETEKSGLEKDKEAFQATAKEIETKFNTLQESFKASGIEFEKAEGKKGEGGEGSKSRFKFNKD